MLKNKLKIYQIFLPVFISINNIYSEDAIDSIKNYVKNIFVKEEKEILTKEYNFNPKAVLEINIPKGNINIKTWNNNKIVIKNK